MTNAGNGHVGGEPAPPRVVITHDFMEVYGGAERVTEQMALAFPDASVYSLLVRPSVARRMGIEDRVHAVLPFRERIARHYRLLAPAYPGIARRVELPDADVLLSSSYAYAQHFATPPGAAHVSYCHSPLRFAWSMTGSYKEEHARGGLAAAGFALLARQQRHADLAASRQVSRYLTQSEFVASQIERFYGREAGVIGAPVDCDLFRPSAQPAEDFFLVCGRLIEPYKRVTVAIEAFAGRPEQLVIAGDGPAMGALRAMAGPNVTFLGALQDDALVDVMQRCRAAIFPSRDDFGLIPVEVMACGRPVLAFSGGGALATVVDGVTGAFFAEQTARSLGEALDRFEPEAYDPARIRDHALSWSADAFRERLIDEVARAAPPHAASHQVGSGSVA